MNNINQAALDELRRALDKATQHGTFSVEDASWFEEFDLDLLRSLVAAASTDTDDGLNSREEVFKAAYEAGWDDAFDAFEAATVEIYRPISASDRAWREMKNKF